MFVGYQRPSLIRRNDSALEVYDKHPSLLVEWNTSSWLNNLEKIDFFEVDIEGTINKDKTEHLDPYDILIPYKRDKIKFDIKVSQMYSSFYLP